LRVEPHGAKPKASLGGLFGFVTQWIARKTAPPKGARPKTGPLLTKPIACADGHTTHGVGDQIIPFLNSNAHGESFEHPPQHLSQATDLTQPANQHLIMHTLVALTKAKA
jgi:hypothetical protein